MKKKELMWVWPDFKKKIKATAASKGMTVLNFTKEISIESDPIEKLVRDYKAEKRRKFDFP